MPTAWQGVELLQCIVMVFFLRFSKRWLNIYLLATSQGSVISPETEGKTKNESRRYRKE